MKKLIIKNYYQRDNIYSDLRVKINPDRIEVTGSDELTVKVDDHYDLKTTNQVANKYGAKVVL